MGSWWAKEETNPGLMDGCGCNQTRLQSSLLRHLPPLSLEFGSECAPGPHSPSPLPGAPSRKAHNLMMDLFKAIILAYVQNQGRTDEQQEAHSPA